MKPFPFLLVLFLLGCGTQRSQQYQRIQKTAENESFSSASTTNLITIDHKYFKIAYNPEKRLAQYVWYQLTADQLQNKQAARGNKFIPDPLLVKNKIPHVVTAEYTNSGYDRGHLAPSADFAWDQDANDLTFVMSNMSPQKPNLNRDAWKRLEEKVRRWACGEEKITVITGPILSNGMPTLKSGLVIPQKFFKVVIDETPPKKILSFIYDQNDRGNVLAERVVPFEKVEVSSGVAFHQSIPTLPKDSRKPASLNEWKEADCSL